MRTPSFLSWFCCFAFLIQLACTPKETDIPELPTDDPDQEYEDGFCQISKTQSVSIIFTNNGSYENIVPLQYVFDAEGLLVLRPVDAREYDSIAYVNKLPKYIYRKGRENSNNPSIRPYFYELFHDPAGKLIKSVQNIQHAGGIRLKTDTLLYEGDLLTTVRTYEAFIDTENGPAYNTPKRLVATAQYEYDEQGHMVKVATLDYKYNANELTPFETLEGFGTYSGFVQVRNPLWRSIFPENREEALNKFAHTHYQYDHPNRTITGERNYDGIPLNEYGYPLFDYIEYWCRD